MIRSLFGSRRAVLRLVTQEWNWLTRPRRGAIWPQQPVRRLVFVCRGNICRSAFAGEVTRRLGVPAVSYGLDTVLGKPADQGMTSAAETLGYDLREHRTTPIDAYVPQPGDLLIVFEYGQWLAVRSRYPNTPVLPLGRFAVPPRTYIHDPYRSTAAFYERTARLVERATIELVQRVTADAQHADAPTSRVPRV
jgi:protein-tyrosine phosphatase